MVVVAFVVDLNFAAEIVFLDEGWYSFENLAAALFLLVRVFRTIFAVETSCEVVTRLSSRKTQALVGVDIKFHRFLNPASLIFDLLCQQTDLNIQELNFVFQLVVFLL